MPDGLLGIDPAQLNALVAQFGGSTVDEDKKQRMIMGLLGMSAGLLGNSRKPLGLGLAGGIEGGVQGYTQEQARQMATRASALNQASNMYGLANQADLYRQNQLDRSIVSDAYRNGAAPASPPQPQMDMPPIPTPPAPRPQVFNNTVGATPTQLAAIEKDSQKNYGMSPISAGAPDSGNSTPMPPQAATQQPSAPEFTGPIVQKMVRAQQYKDIASQLAAKGGSPDRINFYLNLAEKELPKFKETKTFMENGQPITVAEYDDGSTQIRRGLAPAQKVTYHNLGGVTQGVGEYGGTVGPSIPNTMAPGAAASNALGYAHLDETKRHNAAIEGDPEQIESVAQSIANGKQAPLSAYSMSRPAGQAIMGRVMQINPDYNAQDYGTQQKALKDFATGKNGNTVRSLNVAIAHLDTASQLADALKNGNIQLVNKIGNAFGTATGNPAVTNLDTAKQVIGAEVVKAIVGAGGGVGDRDKAQAAFASANSPAQLAGAINTYKSLLGGQLGGLRQQYETTTGRKDFDKFLSASTQTQLGVASGGDPGVRAAADRILQGN